MRCPRSVGRCLRDSSFWRSGQCDLRWDLRASSQAPLPSVGTGQEEFTFLALIRRWKIQGTSISELKRESSCGLKPFPQRTHGHQSLHPTEDATPVWLLWAPGCVCLLPTSGLWASPSQGGCLGTVQASTTSLMTNLPPKAGRREADTRRSRHIISWRDTLPQFLIALNWDTRYPALSDLWDLFTKICDMKAHFPLPSDCRVVHIFLNNGKRVRRIMWNTHTPSK